jgi:glycosidase
MVSPKRCLAIALLSLTCCATSFAQDFRKQVIYQIITDRFYDGDPSNNNPPQSPGMFDPTKTNWQAYWGGDFAGIRLKLPYLKEMGVTALWISPSTDNINVPMMGPDGSPVPYLFAPYHGYINRDFMRTEEHFGDIANSWKPFDAMTAAAHADGIQIVLDFSPNDSNLVNTAEHGDLRSDDKLFAQYSNDPDGMFHHNGDLTDINNRYQLQYYNVFGLADLNHQNPVVDKYIKDSIHRFQDHGVDAVRLDAVRHISWGWTYSFANSLYNHKPSFMFGEWFMDGPGDPYYADACKFANRSGMSLLDYPLAIAIRDVFANDKDFSTISKIVLQEQQDISDPGDLVTFVDNHDIPRLMTMRNDRSRLDEATALVLTARGIPIVYYGDEQYLHNDTNQGRDPYTRPWMSSFNTKTTGFRLVKALSALRQSNDALAYGSMDFLQTGANVLVFERHFANDTVVVAINKNDKTAEPITSFPTKLVAGSYQDCLDGLLGGIALNVAAGSSAALQLPPHSVSVWQSKGPTTTAPALGSLWPTSGQPGMQITLAGMGFGARAGEITVGGSRATVLSWKDDVVVGRVPEISNGVYDVGIKTATGKLSNTSSLEVLQARLVSLTFTVRNVPPGPNTHLFLTGDTVELGSWKTDSKVAPGPFLCPHAPECFLDISVPAGKTVHFSLFTLDKNDAVVREHGEPHALDVPASGTGKISVDWQP